MAQEFTINSSAIESKINQLLPSQGGFGAGVDFSASTMVIPIVDLTESAEGSDVRQDLQTAFSLNSATAFSVANTTTTIVTTTGYYRVFGAVSVKTATGVTSTGKFIVTDGVTSKTLINFRGIIGTTSQFIDNYDFTVFLSAGDSLQASSSDANMFLEGATRQIADISGNLINP